MTKQKLPFFFFKIIISVNHVPSSAPAQPQLLQAAPLKLKLKTDDMSLKSLCCYYSWLRIVNNPSGKSWMFQIFTTTYWLSHYLWLTTWCHLFPQPACPSQPLPFNFASNLCLLILPACAAYVLLAIDLLWKQLSDSPKLPHLLLLFFSLRMKAC